MTLNYDFQGKQRLWSANINEAILNWEKSLDFHFLDALVDTTEQTCRFYAIYAVAQSNPKGFQLKILSAEIEYGGRITNCKVVSYPKTIAGVQIQTSYARLFQSGSKVFGCFSNRHLRNNGNIFFMKIEDSFFFEWKEVPEVIFGLFPFVHEPTGTFSTWGLTANSLIQLHSVRMAMPVEESPLSRSAHVLRGSLESSDPLSSLVRAMAQMEVGTDEKVFEFLESLINRVRSKKVSIEDLQMNRESFSLFFSRVGIQKTQTLIQGVSKKLIEEQNRNALIATFSQNQQRKAVEEVIMEKKEKDLVLLELKKKSSQLREWLRLVLLVFPETISDFQDKEFIAGGLLSALLLTRLRNMYLDREFSLGSDEEVATTGSFRHLIKETTAMRAGVAREDESFFIGLNAASDIFEAIRQIEELSPSPTQNISTRVWAEAIEISLSLLKEFQLLTWSIKLPFLLRNVSSVVSKLDKRNMEPSFLEKLIGVLDALLNCGMNEEEEREADRFLKVLMETYTCFIQKRSLMEFVQGTRSYWLTIRFLVWFDGTESFPVLSRDSADSPEKLAQFYRDLVWLFERFRETIGRRVLCPRVGVPPFFQF